MVYLLKFYKYLVIFQWNKLKTNVLYLKGFKTKYNIYNQYVYAVLVGLAIYENNKYVLGYEYFYTWL
jgi:hypothetical protein